MKTVQFTNIHLENFGKHSEAIGGKVIASKLGHRTIISGSNATGKSTIKRAIQYILGAKDENGKEISGIRPHDENGVDIDGLTTTSTLTISVDGLENTLKRTCFQEKNRQGEYTGKDNLQYFVDDVKKGTKKSYEEFVSSFLPNMACISAQELLMKDTKGRRAMLEPFLKHTNDDVIDENPQFEGLRAGLKANTTEELKKACREKIKERTKKRDEKIVEIRIEESKKVDIDLAELELHRNVLNEQITEVKEKQVNINKKFEEYDEQSKDIIDLRFELNGLQQKANEELEKKRREIRSEIEDIEQKLKKILHQIKLSKQDIQSVEESIRRHKERIESCRTEWTSLNDQLNAENERVFDENSLVCQYCGQEYPEDKKEQKRDEFESHKMKEIERIKKETENVTTQGNKLKSAVEKDKSEIEQLKATLKENEDEEINLKESINGLEKCLEEIPQSIDISDREDVRAIKQQIAEKEQAMKKENSAKEIRQQLQDEYEGLQRQLNEIEKQFDLAKKNDEIDERVGQLRKQQRELSQEIADIERELDLLKTFERRKAELLEEDVNSNFSIIRWHMFKEQANGDLADICSPFVDGTSYDGNLNKGARILTQLDICLSFQKLYDVQMPILLDDGESVDSWRIPEVENQLIIFKRTDDKELKIDVK